VTENQAPAPWRVPLSGGPLSGGLLSGGALSGGPLSGGPLSGISAASITAVLLNLFFNEWKVFRKPGASVLAAAPERGVVPPQH